MKKIGFWKITRWLLLVWFLLTPVFWQIIPSKGALGAYDFFGMAPLAIFHLIIFYALAFLELYFNKFSLFLLLVLALYFPAIQICNYPYLIYRDVYLHAAPAQTVLLNGSVIYPKDPAFAAWPSAYDTHAIASMVFGLDLITSNFVLYILLVVSFTVLLYWFAAKFEQNGFALAGTSAVLFLCLFSNHFFDFNHFSRSVFGFFFLMLFFAFFIFLRGSKGLILQLICAIAAIATHPFVSFSIITFVLSYSIFKRKDRRFFFTLSMIVMVISWFVFIGTKTFQDAVVLIKGFLAPKYVSQLAETTLTNVDSPLWSSLLRDLFKYSLIFLLGIAVFSSFLVVINVLRRRENNKIRIALFSILITSLVMLLSLILLPDWGISRFTAFAAFSAAFSSFMLLENLILERKWPGFEKYFGTKKFKSTIKIFYVGLLCFTILVSAVVMVLKFERNYTYGEMTHPVELSSLSFFFNHDRNSTITLISWRTTVFSAYFNVLSHQTLRPWYKDIEDLAGNVSRLQSLVGGSINQFYAVIRGMRDQYDLGENSSELLNTIDQTMILPYFNTVYCNGNYTVYARP